MWPIYQNTSGSMKKRLKILGKITLVMELVDILVHIVDPAQEEFELKDVSIKCFKISPSS